MNDGARERPVSHADNGSGPPLVSIALCTWNGEAYLRQQLDSLLGQDYPNLEIMALDDASSDATFRILSEYAASHPCIRVRRNPENLGLVRNFEECLRLCSGEFIALCDQDDVWLPHKISTLVAAIGDGPLVYSRVRVMDGDGRPVEMDFPKRKMLQGRCPLALMLTNFVTGHASLLRKSLLDAALPIPDGVLHDHWLAFVAAGTGCGLRRVDEVLSFYRLHGGNQVLGSKRSRGAGADPARLLPFVNSPNLSPLESALAGEMVALMRRGFLTYHWRLHGFLRDHEQLFLAAYRKPSSARRRHCLRRFRFPNSA